MKKDGRTNDNSEEIVKSRDGHMVVSPLNYPKSGHSCFLTRGVNIAALVSLGLKVAVRRAGLL